MTPLSEWKSLVERAHKMIDGILFLVLSALHLVVAAVILFVSIWTALFRTGRVVVDRIGKRIKAPEEIADAL